MNRGFVKFTIRYSLFTIHFQMIIRQALNDTVKKLKQKNIPSANLDAEVLLLEALNETTHPQPPPKRGINKTFLYSHPDYKLRQSEEKVFNDFVSRRLKREPVAYIVGHKEFFGLDFIVNKNVLIPRPETEIIVEEVLKIIQTTPNPSLLRRGKSISRSSQRFNLIDVGTGSGCVAVSILYEDKNKIKNCRAIDVSKKAIKVAEQNAEIILGKNHKIKFITGDFSETLNNCRDIKFYVPTHHDLIITANLPYLSENNYQQTQPEIKNFEPKIALAAKENGLALIKKLLQKIAICRDAKFCAPTVFIFLEIDPSQAKGVSEFAKNIFPSSEIKIIKDLAKKNRVVKIEIR